MSVVLFVPGLVVLCCPMSGVLFVLGLVVLSCMVPVEGRSHVYSLNLAIMNIHPSGTGVKVNRTTSQSIYKSPPPIN